MTKLFRASHFPYTLLEARGCPPPQTVTLEQGWGQQHEVACAALLLCGEGAVLGPDQALFKANGPSLPLTSVGAGWLSPG